MKAGACGQDSRLGLKQGIRDIEFLTDPTAGELTVGHVQSNANTIFPKIVERFSADHPRVVMRADIVPAPSFTFPGLRDRTYDLILARIQAAAGRRARE
jgi:DNA-binding transcriptional LysR family regulator